MVRGAGCHRALPAMARQEGGPHFVDVVLHPPFGGDVERRVLLLAKVTRACHVPLVFVFTWIETRLVLLASVAKMSISGMFPAKVTAYPPRRWTSAVANISPARLTC